ncbi:unnamed protein product [Somion occarium]|uniref:Arf-GAP domain-containing protein n=1 Tax=Somion occarium TaxID=3059160 RepID=A0ABP1D068_9APHY
MLGLVSFVRSVSMDTWQEEQIKRMQLGGNSLFRDFIKSYPAEGGYTEGMSMHDKYHSWAASQYREKLDAELAGKPWSPSSPPAGAVAGTASPPGRPSSAQGLRKSRASARSNTGRSMRSDSPASFGNNSGSNTPVTTPNLSHTPSDQKTANESFFAGLGQANATRPADLPPSQGGKYQGFGNTPTPPPGSQHPSYGLSSAAAPRLSEFQDNPVAAFSKGWSLLSAAVVGASRVVSENVIQPGVQKVTDPNFQAGVRGYVSEAGKRAGEVGSRANMWSKQTLGVDVAEQVGGVVGTVRDRVGGGPSSRGYGVVSQGYEHGESSALYQDHEDEDDFFGEFSGNTPRTQTGFGQSSSYSNAAAGGAGAKPAGSAQKSDDWDEWKDF